MNNYSSQQNNLKRNIENSQENYLNILNCYPTTNISGEKINILSSTQTTNSNQRNMQEENTIIQNFPIPKNNSSHGYNNQGSNISDNEQNNNQNGNNFLNMIQNLGGGSQGFNPVNLLQGLTQNNNMLETILNLMCNFKSDNGKNGANILSNLFNFGKSEEKSQEQKNSKSEIDKFIKVEDIEIV